MIGILVATFLFMLVMVTGLAVGLILRNKEVSGSCGGITSLGVDKVCDCDDPCDSKKARLAEEKQHRIREENRIL